MINRNNCIGVLIAILMLLSSKISYAQSSVGDWKIHATWDNAYEKVIDTPTRTYFQIPGVSTWDGAVGYDEKRSYLFVFDKEADEMMAYTSRNYLNDDVVSYMAYNYDKGYLLIVYINSNIDILYDDDTVYNIPFYMSSVLTADKSINHVTFDDENNRIYLATDFGYLVIDDEKYEIAESHVYDTVINAVGRVGDYLVMLTPGSAYKSPINDRHLSLSSFSVIEGITAGKFLMPLTDKIFGYGNPKLQKATFNDDGTVNIETVRKNTDVLDMHECVNGGYFIRESVGTSMMKTDGYTKSIDLQPENYNTVYSSHDFKEFWFTYGRKGYCSKSYNDDTKEWTVTRDYSMPNAPAVFYSYHPTATKDYGMIIAHEGVNEYFNTTWLDLWIKISGYKEGTWTNYAPAYTTSNPLMNCVADPHGPAIDPLAPNHAYFGTYAHGLSRLNLDDPDDIQVYSYSTDPYKNNPGFYEVFPTSTWQYCHIMKPDFDADNTMWLFHDVTSVVGGVSGFWYWKSEDRLNNNAAGIKKIDVAKLPTRYSTIFTSLKKTKNTLISSDGAYSSNLVVFNHNGTLDNTADDKIVVFTQVRDQDGNTLEMRYLKCIYEDPQTRKVWIGYDGGVFCFNPQDAFDADFRVQRIKVARNDGTNLADYLLDGIPVFDIENDGAGRKWFATNGSGLVVTSADGSEIIRQLTTENSDIPHDLAYSVGIDPYSNSVFTSTYYGIAEYFSDATPAEPTYDNVVAYPNPVRPDYLGWVTIEGLMDNSLVKIVDASGGFVKDLGISNGGMISWDVTNAEGRRVKTGVYYVVASQSTEGESGAKVTKILVVN